MVRNQKTTQQGRVGAIWALQKLTEEESWDIRNYPDEHVREQVFRVEQSQLVEIPQKISPWWISDRSRSVRFQAALALTKVMDPAAVANGVANLAREDGDDSWMRAAILSAGYGLEIPILRRLIAPLAIRETYGFHGSQDPVMVNAELVSTMVKGAVLQHQEGKLRDLIHTIIQVEPLKLSDAPNKLIAIAKGIKSSGQRFEQIVDPTYSAKLTDGWLKESRAVAADRNQPLERRLSAIEVISLFDTVEGALNLSHHLLDTKEPQELQAATIEVLGSYREPAVADILIDAWPKTTPALRDKAITILLSRTDRIAKLLDAIEAKKITPAQLSVAAKATLGRQKTPALAERIAKLIGDGSSSNRKEVIAKYASVMSMTVDVTRGAKIYETACMVCHKFADKGNDVGPHLGTIKAWTAEQLVTNILDPNREVSPNFALYIVETNDGRTLAGLIASETAGNLTLKRADGGTDTVLRSEIKSLTSPGLSLMPEGLEAAITPQQMADLIAYLKAP
jgi:putative heme-binding domain-containing protein